MFPVRNPRECGVLLPCQKEQALWLHLALPFGSTGSVWSYVRIADALTFVALTLLMLPTAHYVDDFFQVEPTSVAESGFQAFQQLSRLLGLRMKESKAKPPSQDQTLLGVRSLELLLQLLPQLRPVRIPLQLSAQGLKFAIVYADAFINLGGISRCANRWLADSPPLEVLRDSSNGIGVCVITQRRRFAFRTEVPTHVLAKAASTKAFIFWLEAVAQLLALAALYEDNPDFVVCFVDNTAAEHALNKGHTKDPAFAWLIGAFWVWAAEAGCLPMFHRVTSAANLADGISRGDLSLMESCQFALCEYKLDDVWQILLRLQSQPENLEQWQFAEVVRSLSRGLLTPTSQ
ncbi:unnamed protein product [Symbiodinium natans]|uniref:Uncharacterized protein n=1 Tax=Symbiodinium natans TaxID=878477 RepID=A0A812JTW4_9DINO|nr:unnamed protein product [Symbiodinium natans]